MAKMILVLSVLAIASVTHAGAASIPTSPIETNSMATGQTLAVSPTSTSFQNQPLTPTVCATPAAWQPTKGAMALNFAALSGYGLGLIDWHTDRYSELFQLTYGFSHTDESLEQTEGYVPAGYDYAASASSWSIAFTPLQRWSLLRLGKHANFFVDAGPYASYSHYQYHSVVSSSNYGGDPVGYQVAYNYDSYALGLKAGADLEVCFLEGWSIQLGYLVSGAWLHFYEPTWQTTNSQYLYAYSGWTFSTGSVQAGLNYYFR